MTDNLDLIIDVVLILISLASTVTAFVKNRRNKIGGIIATLFFIGKAVYDFMS